MYRFFKSLDKTTQFLLLRICNPSLLCCPVFQKHGGGLGGKTPRSPGRPQPGLEAVAAVLHSQAGSALQSIPITMNGTRSDCSLYAAGLCPVRLPHGSRRRGATHISFRPSFSPSLFPRTPINFADSRFLNLSTTPGKMKSPAWTINDTFSLLKMEMALSTLFRSSCVSDIMPIFKSMLEIVFLKYLTA
jgi:hypothetical protein